MNKLIPLILIILGGVLIQAARTDKDPRNVIFEALGIKQRVPDPEPIAGVMHGTLSGPRYGGTDSPLPPGTKVTSV